MVQASFGMGFELENSGEQNDGLLKVAASHARDAQASCVDVAAMIFPTASQPPSEEMLAAVSAKLASLVSSIEARLTGCAQGRPSTQIWQMLAHSGFLREPALIDFVLARVAEDRLEAAIDARNEINAAQQLPAKLLGNEDAHIADAAQSLLAADSFHRRSGKLSYNDLRAELLHQLCWRVVATLEIARGSKSEAEVDAARQLLAEHDEGQTTQNAARKLVHFLSGNAEYKLLDPAQCGLHLFAATVAAKLEIDHDQVLRLFDANSASPAAMMLRGCDLPQEGALAVVYLFKGFALTPRDVQLFERDYARISLDAARTEIRSWALARSQFLLSGAGQ